MHLKQPSPSVGSTGNLLPHRWSPGPLPPKGQAIFSAMALHALPAPPAACKAHRADASCAAGMAAPTLQSAKENQIGFSPMKHFKSFLLLLNRFKVLCFRGTAPRSPAPWSRASVCAQPWDMVCRVTAQQCWQGQRWDPWVLSH